MTPAQGRRQRAELMRAIERERKAKNRSKLLDLRADVRQRRADAHAARVAAVGRCRASRASLPSVKQLAAELRAAKALARAACDADLKEARALRSGEARAAHALASEQKYQRELRRIEAGNRKKLAARPGVRKATRESESDDEVRANLPPELVALWDRVKRSIRGDARRTRTEAFLQYAEEHPDEEWSALESSVDRAIAEMERRQAMPNPKKKKRAKARKRQTTITVRPNPKKRKNACGPTKTQLKRRAQQRRRAKTRPPTAAERAEWARASNPKKRRPRPRGPDELTREALRLATRGKSGDRASMSAGYWRLPRTTRAANLRRLVRKGPKHKRAAAAIARAELAHEGPPRKKNPRMGDGAALAEYERTHWGERGRGGIGRARAADPRHGTATELGTLHSVVYETRKGGDRERTQYEHAFEGKKPRLVYNDGGLIIAGGDYVIREGGIDG